MEGKSSPPKLLLVDLKPKNFDIFCNVKLCSLISQQNNPVTQHTNGWDKLNAWQ